MKKYVLNKARSDPLLRRALPAALAVALLAHGAAWAGMTQETVKTTATDERTTTQYNGWSDPVVANIAVNAGRALVQRLQETKALLSLNNTEQARSALMTSLDFADALQRMVPYLVVVDDIKAAKDKLLTEDINVFYDDLLPIYANLDSMEVYAPQVASHARSKVKQAENKARNGDKTGAAQTLQEVADEVAETTVYLPVDYVDGQIRAALASLKKETPDTATARAAVDNALQSLTAVTVGAVTNP